MVEVKVQVSQYVKTMKASLSALASVFSLCPATRATTAHTYGVDPDVDFEPNISFTF